MLAAKVAAAPFAFKAAAVAAAALAAVIGLMALLLLLAGANVGNGPVGSACHATGAASEIPDEFPPIYASAASRYRLGERGLSILASIHKHESGFGTNMGPSSAGAIGHMQFMPATWAAYGVDANRDGTKDPFDPEDSIHAAARYLRASGAPGDWYRALFAYNHADWYVRMILDGAAGFADLCDPAPGPGRFAGNRLERLIQAADWIDSQRYPYCWGGGHTMPVGPSTGDYCWSKTGVQVFGTAEKGLDCSGAVRWLLVLAGYPDPGGIVSSSFASVYPYGPGQAVTIYSNAGHVFIHVRGRGFWGTTQTNFRHGPGWIASYPTLGFVASHPPGL